MSEEFREFYYRQLFPDEQQRRQSAAAFPFSGSHSPAFSISTSPYSQAQTFDPTPYLSFSENLHGPSDHDNKYLLTEIVKGGRKSSPEPDAGSGSGGAEAPATPNSSLSSSSTEAAAGHEGESSKGKKASEEIISNKEGKGKSGRREKKEKQERVAFITKSEVDHLEDGYRWRKYGQKAVKNSPYPRSYYRCTTQKCLVKKRVERSFQNPSTVVTTYEGKHNHNVPVNLRGHVARMLAPSAFASSLETCGPSFPQELLLHQIPDHLYSYNYNGGGDSNSLYQARALAPHNHRQIQHLPDYGLLQDIIPPTFPKHEP